MSTGKTVTAAKKRRRATTTSALDRALRELAKCVAARARQSRELARMAVDELTPAVETAIATRCQSKIRIEHLLDRLLDFSFDPEVLAIFKKLCRYYHTIDPAATAYYVHSYREMWDEESPVKRERYCLPILGGRKKQ